MLKIKVLPASNGDSILISLGSTEVKNILIDGGTGPECYIRLFEEIEVIKQKKELIDLLIITHIDDDHIAGILNLFEDPTFDTSIFKEVWFNSGENISSFLNSTYIKERELFITSHYTKKVKFTQGLSLETELKRGNVWNRGLISSEVGNEFERFGAVIKILSPSLESLTKLNERWEIEKANETKVRAFRDYHLSIEELKENPFNKDRSVPNESSIAFNLSYEGINLLMLADAHPSVICESLIKLGFNNTTNRLKVDYLKVSHHGSKRNTNYELLGLIECNNFIISTDGSMHGMPHKECLARIINSFSGANLYFNYKIPNKIFTDEDKSKYLFNCVYLEDNNYEITAGE